MADNNIFSQVSESGNYEPISSQSGLDALIDEVNKKQSQMGGKRRGRPAKKVSKKQSGGKGRKSSKKASKKTSKKVSKKSSRKSSKKGSRKQSGGKKSSNKSSKKTSKKTSKKHSRKSSKKTSKKTSKNGGRKSSTNPKRVVPDAIKRWQVLVGIINKDNDVPVKYNEAIAVAKIYKDEMMKTHKLDSLDSINRAIKDYPDESSASKRNMLVKLRV